MIFNSLSVPAVELVRFPLPRRRRCSSPDTKSRGERTSRRDFAAAQVPVRPEGIGAERQSMSNQLRGWMISRPTTNRRSRRRCRYPGAGRGSRRNRYWLSEEERGEGAARREYGGPQAVDRGRAVLDTIDTGKHALAEQVDLVRIRDSRCRFVGHILQVGGRLPRRDAARRSARSGVAGRHNRGPRGTELPPGSSGRTGWPTRRRAPCPAAKGRGTSSRPPDRPPGEALEVGDQPGYSKVTVRCQLTSADARRVSTASVAVRRLAGTSWSRVSAYELRRPGTMFRRRGRPDRRTWCSVTHGSITGCSIAALLRSRML